MGNYTTYIQNIANILRQNKLCSNIYPLTSSYKNGKCRLSKLKLSIKDFPRNTKPIVSSLDVLLDVSFDETSNADIPLSNYSFAITIIGQNANQLVKSSWHLDCDDNNGQVQDYVHPYYHLTWGGKGIKEMVLGDILLLPTPRIPFPPMDIILGIDFVLSNFVKATIYKKIRSNSQYRTAVKIAQEKLWKPYIFSVAHYWCKNQCNKSRFNNINASQFYPTLIS